MKKFLGLVSAGLLVLLLSGCDMLLEKVVESAVQEPVRPSATLEYTISSDGVNIGDAVVLNVKATASDGGALSYQWLKDGKAIAGQTSTQFQFTMSKETVGSYSCDVINTKFGKTAHEVTSAVSVKLRDASSPAITNPEEREFNKHYGEESVLSISATVEDEYGTLSYQWYKSDSYYEFEKNETPISGATESTYTVVGNEESLAYYICKATCTNNGFTKTSNSDIFTVKISNIVVVDSSDVSESTVWNADYTYLINYDCYVSNKLTIPAGTVVKFEKDCFLGTDENGIILAKGEAAVKDDPATEEDETKAAKPVIFTAATDNTVGITIPAYKDLTPTAGYWEGLAAGTQGSIFDNCVIRYAGSEYYGALKLAAKTTVTNCTFTDNATPYDCRGALNIEEDGVKSIVTGNTFYNNEWPLSCPANFTVDSSNIFHLDVEGSNPIKNTNQAIRLWTDNIESTEKATWTITEVPYYAEDIDVWGENLQLLMM